MELAASAVAAAGLKLLNCNRSNFFENLKLQQSRKFRRQQIIAAQASENEFTTAYTTRLVL